MSEVGKPKEKITIVPKENPVPEKHPLPELVPAEVVPVKVPS